MTTSTAIPNSGNPLDRVLASRLRDMRIRARISQATLATRLRRPTSFVGKYENGYRKLDIIEFLAVARAIGFDPGGFLTGILDAREASNANRRPTPPVPDTTANAAA
jgi:transcriptional regulator with XRE-family HTH domain